MRCLAGSGGTLLAGTPFKLGTIQNHLEGDVILPAKEFNELRRRIVAELEAGTRMIGRYRQLLEGEVGGTDLWRELKLINQFGVTRGQMETARAGDAERGQGM